ncbi:tetratricopeptide repeat protein [Streptoalloteichus hindustanus]|uniref:Tetratricopeptide repeat-containing protein n=1 Tax=Streptoalloteichus hindustanus TaxID=2017 RepID=A0A1M5GK92_STRHI|nr:hypothetical protein [Streptoalloteichus hindustanus]SHG04113.1 hypothetical protein SAMN05444320_106155 [Streptoalloteichus hindustanus]
MRILKLFANPGPVAAALAVVAVVALERSVLGTALGLGGAAVGLFAELAALQLGMALGAVLFGARVHRFALGLGPRLWERTTAKRAVVVRAVPILVSVSVGPGRAPVRPRMWLAALSSAVFGLALAVLAAALSSGPFGRGLAVGAVATLLHALLPAESAGSSSTGWALFNLFRLPPERAARMDVAPVVDEALDALSTGDLETAERIAARIAEDHPDVRSGTYARISVLEARGRYGEALGLALGLMRAPDIGQKEAGLTLAGVAGLAACAVEAGQLDAALGVPTARQALDDALQLGYPAHQAQGTQALLALLDGDPATAVRLARSGADTCDHLLSRVDHLATLARAHMAAHDNRAARAALAEAERMAAWWPRVVATRARLEVG